MLNYRSRWMQEVCIQREGEAGGQRYDHTRLGRHALRRRVALLHPPQEQMFTAILGGWRNQQLARRLAFSTVDSPTTHGARLRRAAMVMDAPDARRVDDRAALGASFGNFVGVSHVVRFVTLHLVNDQEGLDASSLHGPREEGSVWSWSTPRLDPREFR
jgi:hypothetical protein